jgi:hypothetical protein
MRISSEGDGAPLLAADRADQWLIIRCKEQQKQKQWLNAGRIALLPQGAVVVNAARGRYAGLDGELLQLRKALPCLWR